MPNGAQISQLVLQVDAQVAVAQRSLQDLARTVQQSSAAANTALGTTDATITRSLSSHHQLGLAFNNARIAQTELTAAVTRSVDAYGAGASPLRILTTEMGRLTEAASFLGGGAGNGVMGSMLRFIGGPWGIALLVGVSVLAKVAGAHKDAGDSVESLVEKMRKQAGQAALNKEADAIWAQSIDALIDRNQKLIDTLQKRLKAEEDLDEQALRGAQADKAKADRELQVAQTQLTNLRAQQQAQQGAPSGVGIGQGAPVTGVAEANLADQISAAEDRVKTAQKAVATATVAIEQSVIAVGENTGKALSSSAGAIEQWGKQYIERLHAVEQAAPGFTATLAGSFDRLKDALTEAAGAKVPFESTAVGANKLINELLHGKIAPEQYAAAMDKLTGSLRAVIKATEDAKKGTGELGKQIGFADAEAIAKGAGLTVTSGYRPAFGHGTPGHQTQEDLYNNPAYNRPGNPVARPGSSAHNGVNGKWALDIAFAPGMTAQSLKKLYGDQGVTLSAVYKESGHYHIEGSTSQATSAQKAADRAAQKQQTDDDQFAKESAQLDAETLAARRQLVAGFDSQADIAAEEVEAQRKAAQDAIQKQLDAKQITVDKAKILSIQADDRAAAQQAVVARRKLGDLLDQQAKALDQAYGFQLDDLKFTDEMARTQSEHRTLQLQILDIQYQQKEADLQHLLDTIKRNKDFATSADLQNQAAGVQADLDRLPTDKAHGQALVEKGTMDPLQAWADKVPKTAAEINEALQSIEVQGLDNLASSIAGVITGTESLGQAFKNISSQIIGDIIQMTVKMLIFRAISSIFGGGAEPVSINAGNTSLVPAGGLPGLSSLFPPRAAGGPVSSGQTYLVGENGPELFVPGASGTIVPRVPRISIPSPANDRGGGSVTVHQNFQFEGVAITQDQFVQGLVATRSSTIQAIRDAQRRR